MPPTGLRTLTTIGLAGALFALAGCGGGESEVVTVTETVTVTTDEGFTDTTETTSTDTVPTGDIANVGDTVEFEGDSFTVTDVETSDTAPVPDLFGQQREAENGIWLSLKIAPTEGNSGRALFSFEFPSRVQLRGGDGVVYDDFLSNATEQDFKNEDDFLVWIDVPEAAVSGAVLEIGDGLHRVEEEGIFGDEGPWDPAYALRIDLGS